MSGQPKFRNFFTHDFLIDATRKELWTREALAEIGGRSPDTETYIFVLSPSHQWVFVDSPDEFERVEFCAWLETVTGAAIADRKAWPDLELDQEPLENWQELALAMPCRVGPGMWDKLSADELHRYLRGGGLPDDYDTRGEPDEVQ